MAPKTRFADGEKVLCFHGPLLYEAKCIKSQTKDKIVKYFIHYSGWNKNWDEWVPESRVLKFNDANMQRQKELEAAHGKAKKTKATGKVGSKKDPVDREATALPSQEKTPKSKAKEVTTPSSSSESQTELQRKKRLRAEPNVETEEEYMSKIEVKIKIPEELKHWIVDDWNLICHKKKLNTLPARVTVDIILSEFIKKRCSEKGVNLNKNTALMETTRGISEYFNVMLGKSLLYKFERPKHAQLMSETPDAQPSQIYGAVHLLRFFTKLGSALAYTPMSDSVMATLHQNIQDLLKYLHKSSANVFNINDYYSPSAEYLKKAS